MMDPPNHPPSIRPRARIGRVLRDKWRIDELLGIGGMATVYAATHCNNGKRVAIKLLHPELSIIPEMRSRFLREGYVANKVTHPCIVSILDDDVADDGSVFLVMDLLDGETVEALRDRSGSALPVSLVVQIIDQLLDVLATAHDAGIVHRDIKPENLFLTRAGTLKVLDFGIARLREFQTATITMTGGGTMGTPAFMPPEQARGRSELVGPRTDLWAVGATMFTLTSGRLVHDAETVNELLLAAMTRVAPPTLTLMPNFPPALAAVIDGALAFEQNARWPDARSMQAALRHAAMSSGVVLHDPLALSRNTPFSSLGAFAAPPAGGNPLPSSLAFATPPAWSGASSPQPGSNPAGSDRGVPPSVPAPPMFAAAPALTALPIKPTPPIMATAPAVTIGAGGNLLLPARGALQPKWILAISGLVVLLSAIGVWLSLSLSPSLRSKLDSGPAQGQAPSAAVTASAEARPAETALTVKPAPPETPSATPTLPSAAQGEASAAPSAPLPSSKPVAQPPAKSSGATPKVSASPPNPDPKKRNERALLDRRN
jgi:eukaryotic-like serine/threonine-protein kinase